MRQQTKAPRRYSPFRHLGSVLWKKRPVHLTLFLTRRCNARCSFCFYLSGADRQQTPATEELSLEELKRLSRALGPLLWLAFSGGEIFLREDLVQIAVQFYERNRPAIILLPTNGLLPDRIGRTTEEILRACPRSTVVVKVSLDGAESVHDRLRGVAGAADKAMRSLDVLCSLQQRYANLELGINSVLCAANQEQMCETVRRLAKQQEAVTHTVSLVRGRIGDQSLKEVDPASYQKVAACLEARLKKSLSASYRFAGARLKTAQDILQRRFIHWTMVEKKRLLPCYAGRLALVVTETGDLYPCESFDMHMGNLRQADFDMARLLQAEKSHAILQRIEQKKCYCTHECAFMLNILFNPRTYPALLGQYLQLCSLRAEGEAA